MMNKQSVIMVVGFVLVAQVAWANKLVVTNTCLQAGGEGYTYVQTDVSWKNSWRATWSEGSETYTNWDAAWIFVKYRYQGGDWQHASLDITNATHQATGPVGATINVGLSTNAGGTNFGAGVFLYRSIDGSGAWTNTLRLRWNYLLDGVLSTSRVDVCVNAIEMVYVPQGSFKVGSGGTENGTFTEGNAAVTWTNTVTPSVPFEITSESALTISNAAGCLWGTMTNGTTALIGTNGVLPEAYPKGYAAFYCMKYDISQGQWVSFFNMLSTGLNQRKSGDLTQGRDITGGTRNNQGKGTQLETNRNTIAWAGGAADATCTTPDVGCNFLSWGDGTAYADWAGLRPMTELEFEKACRGPLTPVPNEWAWGGSSATAIAITNFAGVVGSGTETALPVMANANFNNYVQGPVRCGIFATSSSGRQQAGATYWGIMEMSGNLGKRIISVAGAGRSFTGSVGDGKLDDTTGNANTDSWPDFLALGTGTRAGYFDQGTVFPSVSDRNAASWGTAIRYWIYGFRAVRQASSVVP